MTTAITSGQGQPTGLSRYVRHAGTTLVTIKAGGADTGGRLTVAEFVSPPGFARPLHRHQVEDEMFYVISGIARFECAGETLHAGPGDFVLPDQAGCLDRRRRLTRT